MNIKVICHLMGLILVLEAVFMVPAVLISLYDGEIAAVQSLLLTITAMAAVSAVLLYTARTRKRSFYAQEGFVTVGLSWIVMSVFGCLPFVISGEIPSFVDALFEVVSGFTTTGASILPDVEAISRGLLYWRSFTHWLGGMGMLVFLLAVIPQGPGAGYSMHLLRAESPGPSVGKLTPRLGETAKALYLIILRSPSPAACSCCWAACRCLTACAPPSARRAPAALASRATAWRAIPLTCKMSLPFSWRCSASTFRFIICSCCVSSRSRCSMKSFACTSG